MQGGPYCDCKVPSREVEIDDDEFACWDVCCNCGKIIEDSIRFYNHYDGEDHIEDEWE